MGDFDSLLKTKTSKKKGPSNAVNIYRQGKNEKGQLGGGKLQNLQEIYITSPYYENINATESILIDPSMGYLDD